MPFVCENCGANFEKQRDLRGHEARKRPCTEKKAHKCPNCPKSYTRADNLTRHLAACNSTKNPTMEIQFAEMQARIRTLEQKLSDSMQGAAAATQVSAAATQVSAAAAQVNGPITQVTGTLTQVANQVNNNITVNIRPWGAPLALTDGDVEAALATVPGLAGTPTLAEVVSALMELVKRAHAPAEARNIHLNPKRGDQALALTAGGWATLPLAEATTVLFDAASARMEAPAGRKAAATPRQERERGLRAEVPVQYRIEKETAVQLGLRPMEAHLANTRPGGPGPLLLEKAAGGPQVEAGGLPPPQVAAGGQAVGKPAERIREAIRATPLETRASGALEMGWILAVSKAANVSGKELFEELARGGEELAAARGAARIFTEEKMRLRESPSADA